jgi:hypothetical protein
MVAGCLAWLMHIPYHVPSAVRASFWWQHCIQPVVDQTNLILAMWHHSPALEQTAIW